MKEFVGKKISVIGAARTGLAAAQVLVTLGAEVLLSDGKTAETLGTARLAEMEATGAAFVCGASVEDALPEGTELVVTSPGVPRYAPVLQAAVQREIPVWSEIELAYRITDAPIVAITGTNGKTTTTLLIAAMLDAANIPNIVCGNVSADEIKRSMVEAAFASREMNPKPVLVAEISSFQLEWVHQFRPKVGILTNITPDHLDRHASFKEYAETKMRLFAAQTEDDWAIINYRNVFARNYVNGEAWKEHKSKLVWVWYKPTVARPEAWAWADQHLFVQLKPDEPQLIMAVENLPCSLPGEHSIENVLAAATAALIMGATLQAIFYAVTSFSGVAHRMEFVAEIGGVRYINNSMCTNIAAAVGSLNSVDRPAIVIMGGVDKGLDFGPLISVLHQKAKHVILIGRAAEMLEAKFRADGYEAITRAETLEEAINLAQSKVVSGDTVILSPACASFDMFRDFEHRGVAFRQAVKNLTE